MTTALTTNGLVSGVSAALPLTTNYIINLIFEDVVVVVDPTIPVHISALGFGDVVRIATRPGHHMEPVYNAKTKQFMLRSGRQPHGKKMRVKAFSRTSFFGYITRNTPSAGVMEMQVETRDRQRSMHAIVPYASIKVIQKYITPGKPIVDAVPLGGGLNAVRRPGTQALGFGGGGSFLNLVQVIF